MVLDGRGTDHLGGVGEFEGEVGVGEDISEGVDGCASVETVGAARVGGVG